MLQWHVPPVVQKFLLWALNCIYEVFLLQNQTTGIWFFKQRKQQLIREINRENMYLHLWLNTWTECTSNSACQTQVFGQVVSLHVLQKSYGDSRARFLKNVTIFAQKSDGLYWNIWPHRFFYKSNYIFMQKSAYFL